MAGLYDRLLDQIGGDDDDQPAGLTPLDISDLPEDQRQIMFWMLRHPKASAGGVTPDTIREHFDDVENLNDLLDDLTRNNWLIRMGEAPAEHYKVNLRRKRPSKLSANMWASLSDKLDDDDDDGPDEDSSTRYSKPGLPSLSDW